jgi:hypothetical protein
MPGLLGRFQFRIFAHMKGNDVRVLTRYGRKRATVASGKAEP